MKKVLDWLLMNKLKTAVIIFLIFVIPLFVANILFLIPASNEFFVAKWGAGDFIS